MIVGRILGGALICAAIAVLGFEVVRYFQTGQYHVVAGGRLWFDLHPGSLDLAQAIVQRHVHPAVWNTGIAPALQLPAWALFGVPGLALAWLFRARPERRPARA